MTQEVFKFSNINVMKDSDYKNITPENGQLYFTEDNDFTRYAVNSGSVVDNNPDYLYVPREQEEITAPFVQPILTSDTSAGTVGGEGFAVFASSSAGGVYQNYPWKAFNENSSFAFTSAWLPQDNGSSESWIGWYNENPIKAPSYTIRNSTTDSQSYYFKTGRLDYSNDGINWEVEQGNISNSNFTAGGYWTFNVVNPIFSKYKRLVCTLSTRGSTYVGIANIQFNNAEQLIQSAVGSSVVLKPNTVITDSSDTYNVTGGVVDLSNRADGDYNIWFNKGELVALSNELITSSITDNPNENDIWQPACEPLQRYLLNNSEWQPCDYVLLGTATVADGNVDNLKVEPLNNNYFNLNYHNNATIIETYKNNTSWYRVYSDGWIEQGGKTNSYGNSLTVNLLQAYSDTNFTLMTQVIGGNSSNIGTKAQALSKSQIGIYNVAQGYCYWYTCGY